MFQAIILPIFRKTGLCVTACCIMHLRFCRPGAVNVVGALYHTQSTPPENGQNCCPKHVDLSGINNKHLLLHVFGCLCYLYFINYLFWYL